MSDNLDPKEKRAILIFFAILLVISAYVYTHDLPWEHSRGTPQMQSYDDTYPPKSQYDSQDQPRFDRETQKNPPPKYDSESYF